MSEALAHTYYMTGRHLKAVVRQPWTVIVSLLQPIVWLLLFGSLFGAVAKIPGFTGGKYVSYLTPGVIVMTTLFASGWNGMYAILDIDSGLMDRLLTTPLNRSSILLGRLLQQGAVLVVQSLVIIALAFADGARFHGGPLGVLVLLACAVMLGIAVGSLSNALGLVVRKMQVLITAVQAVVLPLTFLSGAYMQLTLAPRWIRAIATYNPVNWAADAARRALVLPNPDWGSIGTHLGMLAAVTVVCTVVSVRAFGSYRRAI